MPVGRFTVEHPHLLRKGREEIWRLVSLIPPKVSTMLHPVHINAPASARSAVSRSIPEHESY